MCKFLRYIFSSKIQMLFTPYFFISYVSKCISSHFLIPQEHHSIVIRKPFPFSKTERQIIRLPSDSVVFIFCPFSLLAPFLSSGERRKICDGELLKGYLCSPPYTFDLSFLFFIPFFLVSFFWHLLFGQSFLL